MAERVTAEDDEASMRSFPELHELRAVRLVLAAKGLVARARKDGSAQKMAGRPAAA